MRKLPSISVTQAMFLALIGFSLWTFSDAIVRLLKDYDNTTMAFIASSAATIFALILSPFLGGLKQTFTHPKLILRLLRGGLIALGSYLSFIAFAHLDLATGYAIIFTAPLAAKVLSALWTGEEINRRSWLVSLAGFVGVLIVVRPGLIPVNVGSLAAIGLALLFAAGLVMGKKIGKENQTLLSLALFQYSFLALGSFFFAIDDALQVPWQDVLLASMIGVFGVSGAVCVSYAYVSAPTAHVAPIHYVQILWGILLGAFIFNEYPDFYTLIGGSIIVIAGLLLIKYSR